MSFAPFYHTPGLVSDWNDRPRKALTSASDWSATGIAPIALLRPIFFHISRSRNFGDLRGQILQVLQEPTLDESQAMVINRMTGTLDAETRLDFRKSLARHLFGWNYILRMRMKLAVADMCWVGAFASSELAFTNKRG